MTETTEHRKNRGDAEAALLALGAAQEDDQQHCLSPEEIAAFVENPMQVEKREQILNHLGECASCYEKWLYLHQHIAGKSRRQWAGNVIGFINSRRTLSWAGSLVGIAAAVVVFLQLRTDYVGLKQVETAAPEHVNEQAMDHVTTPLEEDQFNDTSGAQKKELPAPKHRQDTARKPVEKQEQFSLDKRSGAPQKHGELNREELTAPEASRSPATVQTPPAISGGTQTSAERAGDADILDVLAKEVRSGCAEKRWEKIFWREMEEQLVQAGNRNGAMTRNKAFQHLAQLIALAADSGGNENICAEIMVILERLRY